MAYDIYTYGKVLGFQGCKDLRILFRIVKSLRMYAVSATLES